MQQLRKPKTIKLAALTAGKDVPSARFRVRQYRQALFEKGVVIREYCPVIRQMIRLPGVLGRVRRRYLLPWMLIQAFINGVTRIPALLGSRRADITLINRSVIPGLEESVKLLARPRILDVDDAIWLTDPRGLSSAIRLARSVDAIIAGNEYIADWYQQYNKRVFVVPTAVDTEIYTPAPRPYPTVKGRCTIGWMGTSGNFSNLDLIRPALMQVLMARQGVKVLIVSDQKPQGWDFDGEQLEFRYWSAANEVRDLQSMDIGVMPLHDDAWTRGKCSFKMLQYMAVGLPVVVSPVGMNREIMSAADVGFAVDGHDNWVHALDKLCSNLFLKREKGANGRRLVERKYSTSVIAGKLAHCIYLVLSENKNNQGCETEQDYSALCIRR